MTGLDLRSIMPAIPVSESGEPVLNFSIDVILQAVAAGVMAQVTTNLDNLLLALGMAAAIGLWRGAAVFVSVQWLVIALAFGIGEGIACVGRPLLKLYSDLFGLKTRREELESVEKPPREPHSSRFHRIVHILQLR